MSSNNGAYYSAFSFPGHVFGPIVKRLLEQENRTNGYDPDGNRLAGRKLDTRVQKLSALTLISQRAGVDTTTIAKISRCQRTHVPFYIADRILTAFGMNVLLYEEPLAELYQRIDLTREDGWLSKRRRAEAA